MVVCAVCPATHVRELLQSPSKKMTTVPAFVTKGKIPVRRAARNIRKPGDMYNENITEPRTNRGEM
jgi:hypothetical protein